MVNVFQKQCFSDYNAPIPPQELIIIIAIIPNPMWFNVVHLSTQAIVI